MSVLVTGGAGFIGANLVRALLAEGTPVRVLDDFSTGLAGNLDGLPVEVIDGSIEDPDLVLRACDGVTAVAHLAARGSVPRSVREPLATHAVNDTGTVNVLLGAREAGAQVLFASSSSVYGVNAELPKREEMWTQPMSPYGASKLAAESYAMSFRQVYDLPVLCLRFFNVYGPWQRPDHDYAAVIPRFAWRAVRGEPLTVFGDGEQTRDFTHVDSVVAVLVDAIRRGLSWERPVNLAFGDCVSVNDVVAELRRQVGPVTVEYLDPRPGDIPHSRNDPALLHRLFPDARAVPFDEGLASTLVWIRKEHGDG